MCKCGCRVILREETTSAKAVRQAHARGQQDTLRSQPGVARVSEEGTRNERSNQKLIMKDQYPIVNVFSLLGK